MPDPIILQNFPIHSFQPDWFPPVLRRVSAELAHGGERRPLRRGGGGQVRGGARGQRHQGPRGAGRAGTAYIACSVICTKTYLFTFQNVFYDF